MPLVLIPLKQTITHQASPYWKVCVRQGKREPSARVMTHPLKCAATISAASFMGHTRLTTKRSRPYFTNSGQLLVMPEVFLVSSALFASLQSFLPLFVSHAFLAVDGFECA